MLKIGNVCTINDIECVITEVVDDYYYAITFGGEKMISNCPVYIAENMYAYLDL